MTLGKERGVRARDAVEPDLPTICAIYNRAVRETFAIWSETETTVAQRAVWMRARRELGFPVLVASPADAPSEVLGYASFGVFRDFPGYVKTVEHSVYVANEAQRRGVGRLLLATLEERARAGGFETMVGGIDATNDASLKLHEQAGFELQGVLKGVGRKFGKSLDLAFMVKRLT
jgi:L-amino acid N-acyltransferase YncA